MRIAIVGAGAIGAWLGVRLARVGHEVGVLARGDTLTALRQARWRLETADGVLEAEVEASDDARVLGQHDLVIVAVKSNALPIVAPSITMLLGRDGLILPVMNGVPWWFHESATDRSTVGEHADGLAALPLERLIAGVAHVSAEIRAPGHTRQVAGNSLLLGEPLGGVSQRAERAADMLRNAGVDASASAAIRHEIWYKLWGNMTINPIAALTGATADRILDDPLVEALVCRVMEEAKVIGRAIGCEIDEEPASRNAITRRLGAFRPSMLHDAEAGRPLEVDALLEAPWRIAQSLGIETPALDALLGLMRLFANTRRP